MKLPKHWTKDPKKYNSQIWWKECRERLKPIYQKKGITSCELKFEGCMKTFAMSFHHRHKRWWYISRPELLGEFNQTILVCAYCHNKIETDKQATEKLFNKLRGNEGISNTKTNT